MSDQAALFRESTACPVLGSSSKRWGKDSLARSNLAGTPRPMCLHFSGSYACHKKQQRETKEELSDPITEDEGVKAIKSTRGGKAPGQDGIPAELWRHGGIQLRKELVKLSNACWSNECIPQDFNDAVIITIYKKRFKE